MILKNIFILLIRENKFPIFSIFYLNNITKNKTRLKKKKIVLAHMNPIKNLNKKIKHLNLFSLINNIKIFFKIIVKGLLKYSYIDKYMKIF